MPLKRVDAFDEKTDAEIVDFSIEGVAYQIDLSAENKQRLYTDLDRYIQAATHQGAHSPTKKAAKKASTARRPAAERAADLNAIRDWAKRNGRKVSDRGRIPRDIVDAFNQEHAPASPSFSASNA